MISYTAYKNEFTGMWHLIEHIGKIDGVHYCKCLGKYKAKKDVPTTVGGEPVEFTSRQAPPRGKAESDIPYHYYTEEESKYIEENYKSMTHEEIAEQLGRSKRSVSSYCSRKGFKKNG